jgi:hypothetical protein
MKVKRRLLGILHSASPNLLPNNSSTFVTDPQNKFIPKCTKIIFKELSF